MVKEEKVKGYRLISRNREWSKKTGIPTLETYMELNKDLWHLSGYKPLSERFNPDWFRPAYLDKKRNHGKYTLATFGTREFKSYWDEQMDRCIYGYTTNGFFCPGDLYFFLNFYVLPKIVYDPRSGLPDRVDDQPDFWEVHYMFSHYITWVKKENKDAICLKPRGVGWSEYVANMGVNYYTNVKGSKVLYCASAEQYLIKEGILNKAWKQMDNLNMNTQRGMRKVRMKINNILHRRSSMIDAEGNEHGWMSEILGQVIDRPDKLRGMRTNMLVFEEAGSFLNIVKAVMTAKALVEIGGVKFGFMVAFGTGGDESSKGLALQGLKKMFTIPHTFNMLGLKSNFTADRKVVTQGFFFPAYACMYKYMNHQGVTDYEKAYEELERQRKTLEEGGQIKELMSYKAEYPYYADEAFMRAGSNDFDTIKASNQLLRLSTDKTLPVPERGELQWVYKENTSKIVGVKWIPTPNGRIEVLEKPDVDRHGRPYKNLYVGGIDSIDMGVNTSIVGEDGSKFAMLVKKRFYHAEKTGNLYVAKYLERPKDERDAYEIALKLCIWYGCKVNVERTKKEIISYFRTNGMLKMISKQPSIVTSDLSPNSNSNLDGTPINEKTLSYYLSKINDYLRDYSELIFFPDLLNEIINYDYDLKTKFDLIAAMGMCEMLDEDVDAKGIIPRPQENLSDNMKLWGYYIGADGYKKFGPIPSGQVSANEMYKKLGFETPDELLPKEDKDDNDPFDWVYEDDLNGKKLVFDLN